MPVVYSFELGNRKAYATVVDSLLSEIPKDHYLYWEIRCRKAANLYHGGRVAEGKSLAEEACKNKESSCCNYPNNF